MRSRRLKAPEPHSGHPPDVLRTPRLIVNIRKNN
jgi:hypothetical protein